MSYWYWQGKRTNLYRPPNRCSRGRKDRARKPRVRKEGLFDEAIKLATKISKGPAAIRFAKQAINGAFALDAAQAMRLASRLYGEVYKTHDAKEGISAYLEKRKPELSGS